MVQPRRGQLCSWTTAVGVALTLVTLCGCQDNRGPVSVHSHDPDLEILAIKRDHSCPTHDELAQIVADLSNDDPAIRFYAIQCLERITHDDFGYRFYEDDDHRGPAVKRWQDWMKGR